MTTRSCGCKSRSSSAQQSPETRPQSIRSQSAPLSSQLNVEERRRPLSPLPPLPVGARPLSLPKNVPLPIPLPLPPPPSVFETQVLKTTPKTPRSSSRSSGTSSQGGYSSISSPTSSLPSSLSSSRSGSLGSFPEFQPFASSRRGSYGTSSPRPIQKEEEELPKREIEQTMRPGPFERFQMLSAPYSPSSPTSPTIRRGRPCERREELPFAFPRRGFGYWPDTIRCFEAKLEEKYPDIREHISGADASHILSCFHRKGQDENETIERALNYISENAETYGKQGYMKDPCPYGGWRRRGRYE